MGKKTAMGHGGEDAMATQSRARIQYIDSSSEEEEVEEEDKVAAEDVRRRGAEEAEQAEVEGEEEEEDDDDEGAGLAAAELADERLFPGDTIEYYSMAFVFGDPRGYRIAKVLKVAHEEPKYPIRLDSQELLPKTQMIKRKLNRRGEDIEAGASVWRKIRTFGLVDGQVKGKTRADHLNEGLKNAVSDAFKSLRTGEPKKKDKTLKPVPTSSKISSFFSKAPKMGTLETVAVASSKPSKKKAAAAAAATPPRARREKPRSESESSPFVKLPPKKRPRIDLTPSPSEQRRQERDHRDHRDRRDHRTPPTTSSSLSRGRESGRDRERKATRRDDGARKSPQKKFRLQAFVESVEERKGGDRHRIDPNMDLDTYLAIEKEKQEREVSAKAGVMTERRESSAIRSRDESGAHASSGSSRMRAGGKSDAGKPRKSHIRVPTMHRFFKAPPRPHPNAAKQASAGAQSSKLSFIMDAENRTAGQPVDRGDLSKGFAREEERGRDVVKSPKKKGLAASMDTWINKSKKR